MHITQCTLNTAYHILHITDCTLQTAHFTLPPAHLTQGESELLAALVPLTQWVGLEEPQQQVITLQGVHIVKLVHEVPVVRVITLVPIVDVVL